jgi:hypothetical protein
MADTQPLFRQPLQEDRRSQRLWLLLLILGIFVTVVSWLDWTL